MAVVMRMFFEGDEFTKFLKFAGNYLDTFALVFDENGVHILNTDVSKVAFFSKKFEHVDTEATIVPSEPLKFMVSDMLVSIIKKLGSKGYYMLEYSEGDDHLVIGHGKDPDDWEEFYKVHLNITGTPDEVEEIYSLFDRFLEIKKDVGVYSFKMTSEDFGKIVKISNLFDTNITFNACEDKVEVLFTKDGKRYGSKKFRADSCELEKVNDEVSDCVKTTISNSVFKYFNQLPKTTEYTLTVGEGAPLTVEDDYSTFLFVIAPVME